MTLVRHTRHLRPLRARGYCMPVLCLCLLALLLLSAPLRAQEIPLAKPPAQTPPPPAPEKKAPEKVEVRPAVQDEEIAQRIQRILQATGWFDAPRVSVEQGVVFLAGAAESEEAREWARELAQNTRDVVAVVNRMELSQPPLLDFSPALGELRDLWRRLLGSLPLILFALGVLLITALLGMLTTRAMRSLLRERVTTHLLREVVARATGIFVLVLGLYLVLLVVGLARLAITVLTGTGLVGLIIGIAFRDITENFLASIFLSMQHPFHTGDLVEIEGIVGLVQRLTIRTTVLMALDGNHVQIPNSTVYKSTIRNFTSNPNRREEFSVGIGYTDTISHAQEVALGVLNKHPAVLQEPEPWVLVDTLGKATVNLRVYFWLDGTKHSWLKVRSSVIRLVKRAFEQEGITMPDEAREVIFPQGVPVRMIAEEKGAPAPKPPEAEESRAVSTSAEAQLSSDTAEVEEQARRSRVPEEGENLL